MEKAKKAIDFVSLIENKKKEISNFFIDVNVEDIDFVGASSPYVIEKINSLINYLTYLKKEIKTQ